MAPNYYHAVAYLEINAALMALEHVKAEKHIDIVIVQHCTLIYLKREGARGGENERGGRERGQERVVRDTANRGRYKVLELGRSCYSNAESTKY